MQAGPVLSIPQPKAPSPQQKVKKECWLHVTAEKVLFDSLCVFFFGLLVVFLKEFFGLSRFFGLLFVFVNEFLETLCVCQ